MNVNLQSLLVLVVIFGILASRLVKDIKLVNQRREILARYDVGYPALEDRAHFTESKFARKIAPPTESPDDISAIRRWLGDKAVGLIVVFDESIFETVVERFPETWTVALDQTSGWKFHPDRPPTIESPVP